MHCVCVCAYPYCWAAIVPCTLLVVGWVFIYIPPPPPDQQGRRCAVPERAGPSQRRGAGAVRVPGAPGDGAQEAQAPHRTEVHRGLQGNGGGLHRRRRRSVGGGRVKQGWQEWLGSQKKKPHTNKEGRVKQDWQELLCSKNKKPTQKKREGSSRVARSCAPKKTHRKRGGRVRQGCQELLKSPQKEGEGQAGLPGVVLQLPHPPEKRGGGSSDRVARVAKNILKKDYCWSVVLLILFVSSTRRDIESSACMSVRLPRSTLTSLFVSWKMTKSPVG